MALYDRVAQLPLHVDDYSLEGLEQQVSREFARRTTVIHLHGGGQEGVGEDITYDGEQQELQQRRGAVLPLAGDWTIDSFSEHVGSLPLFEGEVEPASLDHRRWGYESAALDLALRQAGTSIAAVVDREPKPITYVVSMRAANLQPWLELYPNLRFKLDPDRTWTDEFVAELVAGDCIDVTDLKGIYRGDWIDNAPDPPLYRRVAETFPRAWIEDPWLTPETDEVLRPHRDRVTWDAPIHSVADIDALPFPPRCLNVKPSRFGSVRRLFDFYDTCAERGILMYGGGQFELGPGRGQIQVLASLFHPDMPNDVAPSGFNSPEPRAGLPESPLEPRLAATGFRRELDLAT
jgi:hypothetical protein